MKFSEVLVLFAAGTLGGIFSTVVSIASLVTYPVLLALGVPPLSANMTRIKRLSRPRTAGTAWGKALRSSRSPCTSVISAPPRESCCWWC